CASARGRPTPSRCGSSCTSGSGSEGRDGGPAGWPLLVAGGAPAPGGGRGLGRDLPGHQGPGRPGATPHPPHPALHRRGHPPPAARLDPGRPAGPSCLPEPAPARPPLGREPLGRVLLPDRGPAAHHRLQGGLPHRLGRGLRPFAGRPLLPPAAAPGRLGGGGGGHRRAGLPQPARRRGVAAGPGDLLVLLGAAAFALQILLVDRWGAQHDPLLLAGVELATVALLSLPAAIAFEGLPLRHPPRLWLGLAYLAVPATAVALWVQIRYQHRTDPTRVGIILGTEPLFGALLAWLFLGERMTEAGLLGGVLVLAGLLLTELGGRAPQAEGAPRERRAGSTLPIRGQARRARGRDGR